MVGDEPKRAFLGEVLVGVGGDFHLDIHLLEDGIYKLVSGKALDLLVECVDALNAYEAVDARCHGQEAELFEGEGFVHAGTADELMRGIVAGLVGSGCLLHARTILVKSVVSSQWEEK